MKATTARAIYDAVKDKPSPARAALDARMSEAEFRAAVCDLLTLKSWCWQYLPDSRRVQGWPNRGGMPDLLATRDGRLLFIELKTEKGKIRPEQRGWLTRLEWTTAEVYVWRPSDMKTIESILA